MPKKKPSLTPEAEAVLSELGKNLRLARIRRNITLQAGADAADISLPTLWQIERGSPSVAIGSYVKVLATLGLVRDLKPVAADKTLVRKLQAAETRAARRAASADAPKAEASDADVAGTEEN